MNKIEITKEYVADLLDELQGEESNRPIGQGISSEEYVLSQLLKLWDILNGNITFPNVTGSDLRFKANRFYVATAGHSCPASIPEIKTAYQIYMQEQEK